MAQRTQGATQQAAALGCDMGWCTCLVCSPQQQTSDCIANQQQYSALSGCELLAVCACVRASLKIGSHLIM